MPASSPDLNPIVCMGIYKEPPTDQCQAEDSSGAEGWAQGILVNTDTSCLPKVHWTLEEGDTQSQ